MEPALAHGPAILLRQVVCEVFKLWHGDFRRVLNYDSVESAMKGILAVSDSGLGVFKHNRFAHVINTWSRDQRSPLLQSQRIIMGWYNAKSRRMQRQACADACHSGSRHGYGEVARTMVGAIQ